jgi:hypothetical protein
MPEKYFKEPVMPEVCIPINAELVRDIILYSDGKLDPFTLANDQLRYFIERSVETAPEHWGDHLYEVAEKYAPWVREHLDKDEARLSAKLHEDNQPLVWKEISVPAGSEVRMAYGDKHHYASIRRGHIVDDGKEYSPSEWASKVADGTSRNAWRDLWFKEPFSKTWVPAQLLREQTQEAQKRGEKNLTSSDNDL